MQRHGRKTKRVGVYRFSDSEADPLEHIRVDWLYLSPHGMQQSDLWAFHISAAELYGTESMHRQANRGSRTPRFASLGRGTRSNANVLKIAKVLDDEWSVQEGIPVLSPSRVFVELVRRDQHPRSNEPGGSSAAGRWMTSMIRDGLVSAASLDDLWRRYPELGDPGPGFLYADSGI